MKYVDFLKLYIEDQKRRDAEFLEPFFTEEELRDYSGDKTSALRKELSFKIIDKNGLEYLIPKILGVKQK